MKREELSIVKRLYYYMTLLVVVLLTACSSDETINNEEPLPEGMGRIRITITTPENAAGSTRAVNAVPWEDPDHEWERLQTFRILICQKSGDGYEVKSVIAGTKNDLTEVAHTPAANVGTSNSTTSTHKSGTFVSEPLPAGTYYIFAVANFTETEYQEDYAVESIIDPNAIMPFPNSSCYYIVGDDTKYSVEDIPMTGKLLTKSNGDPIKVENGKEEDAGTIAVWRVIGKMQFEFTNESDRDIKILGIEVDPINKVSTSNPGIYLFSKDNLESEANLAPGATPPSGKEGITLPDGVRDDMGPVSFVPPTVSSESQPLVLAAKNSGTTDEGKIYFYVNESDGTFTTTNNQYSLRFKVQRKKDDSNWYTEEIRYGVTTHHDLSDNGSYGGYNGGFNVIRRNDWIHIPIVLTDWQFRIEPLALVPIAGYPAKTVSSDGLTATFNTGGYIILQPFVKKYNDPTWRDFSDPEITYGKDRANWTASIHWKNSDGENKAGDDYIVKTAFAYDEVNHCIVGELNQNKVGSNSMTTFTIEVTLGPENDTSKQYGYSFTFNVVLQ